MPSKVGSIITAPVRLLARLFKLLGRPFGAAGRKLGGLQGRQRIIVFGTIGVLAVVALLALRPGPDVEEEVRTTLDRYAAASRDKDYQALCDDLLASELVDRIRSAGLPCEVALRTGLEGRQNPTLTVLGVEVNGDQALARVSGTAVGEVPATSTYRLVKEDGDWRIATPPGGAGEDGTAAAP